MATKEKAVNVTKGNIDSMLQKFNDLTSATRLEMGKFFIDGEKKAGSASRKYLQEVKKICQELRLMVQEVKSAGK